MEQKSMTADYTTVPDHKVSIKSVAFLCLVTVSAFYINTKNHLLFHSSLEIFNITIAFCIFIIASISSKINDDTGYLASTKYLDFQSVPQQNKSDFMLFGIAFMFSGIMDFLHTVAYPGIGIFNGYNSTNLSTQLFVAARYIESASLLAACLLFGKKIRFRELLVTYFIVIAVLLSAVFMYDLFPDCYIIGTGYTVFEEISDIVAAVVLVLTIFILYKRKGEFPGDVFIYLAFSFTAAILAELLFAISSDINDFFHISGNILRFVSYYFIYKGLVENSIISPQRRIKDMNVKLEENNIRLKDINEALKNEINERIKFQKDVEENKRLLEEAEKYDRLKNEFMANVSHELRTPLNIIFSDIQLIELYMKENNLKSYDENIDRHIAIMKQNCYRLLRLVNNIIDISKMDSGFYELQLKNCEIVSLIEGVTMSAVPFAENKGINLVFDTDVEEQVVAIDPDKIERVVLNLLSNAVKFTNPGGSIRVLLKNINSKLYIIVKDNGIGIPKNKLQVIFERFVQLDPALSRAREGSGIGLSLVKSIVEAHGGRIMVKSEVGLGSEFVVEIPQRVLPGGDDGIQEDFLREPGLNKVNIEFSDI